MRYQGLSLGGGERRAIAEFLTGRTLRTSATGTAAGVCAKPPPFANPTTRPLWNGWGPSLDNTHVQSTTAAGLAASDVPHLRLKWAFGFQDATSAWAQPTIAGGRLFVGSQSGTVYSLNAATGCIAWTFTAHAGVRASVSVGPFGRHGRELRRGPRTSPIRSDLSTRVNAANGKLLWSRKVEEHPLVRLTGSPALFDGRLYVPTSSYEEGGKPAGYPCCTFRGSLLALDARTGDLVWQAFTIPETASLLRQLADGSEEWGPSGGAIWSAPTIDAKRGAIYVGVGNAYSGPVQPTTDAVVAFDLKTGAMRWSRQMTPGATDVFGCLPGEVNCREPSGTGLRLRRLTGAREATGRPRPHRRRTEIRSRLRARSRSPGRADLALSRRRRLRAWRHSVGRGRGCRARLRPGRRNLHTGTRRPARGGTRDRQARLVRGAAAAGVRQAESILQRGAVFRGDGDSRSGVLAVE